MGRLPTKEGQKEKALGYFNLSLPPDLVTATQAFPELVRERMRKEGRGSLGIRGRSSHC